MSNNLANCERCQSRCSRGLPDVAADLSVHNFLLLRAAF